MLEWMKAIKPTSCCVKVTPSSNYRISTFQIFPLLVASNDPPHRHQR